MVFVVITQAVFLVVREQVVLVALPAASQPMLPKSDRLLITPRQSWRSCLVHCLWAWIMKFEKSKKPFKSMI
jgi:hypothetical protein